MSGPRRLLTWIALIVTAMAVWEQLRRPMTVQPTPNTVGRNRRSSSGFHHRERARSRWWNPDDERLFLPTVFGVGWTVNLARLPKLLASAAAD
jgi:hypothetical protein